MNRISIIVCMLASLITLNGEAAQQRAVRVLIPFDFNVAGAHLPAGAYTIATRDGLTSITKSGSLKSTYVQTIPVSDNGPDDSKVVFSVLGDQHFLRQILCHGLSMSVEPMPSKPAIMARTQPAGNPGD